ncbi:hypothetical protein [Microbacterium thalassium]|uniref:Uncharacterized protein n=1 Tax=Microbacterium thalassium TaxID=362649 RepID=A0A7X0FP28_9MICO|nr:hypothetical protein [Microbacterium thalassium]MBB6391085.1 hypothetical protein [Microbacterium thalassium]GLK23804.1 hypothetical protein GCM10017607_11220 [Microbacterium thalassium]
MDGLSCSWSVEDFEAFAIYTGESRHIRVIGTGTCPTTGFEVGIEVTNGGINPTPGRLHLALTEVEPAVGGAALTPVGVQDFFDVGQDITEVAIRHVGVIPVSEPG